MNNSLIGAALLAALAGVGGYWAGQRHDAAPETPSAAAPRSAPKILYYRNPMGLPDTSSTPKKDPMGMDYIPVYAGEADEAPAAAGTIKISPDKVQKLGVRTEAASLRSLDKTLRAAGRIEPDERRSYAVSAKFEGYVERLHVNATGQAVRKGQALFEAYSPELISAQREYALAAQGVESLKNADPAAREGMRQLAAASLTRLRNWDISEAQLKTLAKSGETRRSLSFLSPVSGIVTEKKALQGMRFMAGETLYQVADLSALWVVADVFEQDLAWVKPGAKARIKVDAYPDKVFEGAISYIYPSLNAETRTLPVRVELANPHGLLKPGMFAQLELSSVAQRPALTVPASAVIDSGTRQIVLVQVREGRFEPRAVKLGTRGDGRVEVRDGVREGEQVVVSANFLIDAESNLQAALDSFGRGSALNGTSNGAAPKVGHHAEGKVEEVDAQAGTASISHGPVASLNWPPMTMEFTAANKAILAQLQPGAAIDFEFVERGKGEWVVTAVRPTQSAQPASRPAHAAH